VHINLRLATALLLSALAAGCFQSRDHVTLNPDGSGKVVVEMVFAQHIELKAPQVSGTVDLDALVMARQIVRMMIDKSPDVDTWGDLALSQADDGSVTFKGTAYFKDFAGYMNKGPVSVKWAADPKGGMVLTIYSRGPRPVEKEDEASGHPAAPEKPALTDDEIATRAKTAQDEYNQMLRPMMEAVFTKVVMEMTCRLPGTLAEVRGFEKQPDGTVKFAIDGARMLAAADEIMKDPAYLAAAIKADKKPTDPSVLLEGALSSMGPFTARVTGEMKPLFDYNAEVKAAREAYPNMIEKLGLDKESGIHVESGLTIKNMTIRQPGRDEPPSAPPADPPPAAKATPSAAGTGSATPAAAPTPSAAATKATATKSP
jgi:hypothetical protein